MPLSRRQFLTRAGLASGGLLLPSWLGNPFVRDAHAAASGKSVILVHLDGGNDGLATVTPLDDGSGTLRTDYDANRTNLGIAPGALLPIGADANTGAQLGLHPGMSGLKTLFDGGDLAILQGCGYPEPRLSHDGSNRAWRTGHPVLAPASANGWVGNTLVDLGYIGTDIPAVNIGKKVAPSFRQAATNVLAFESLDDFGFPYDLAYPTDDLAKRACVASYCAEAMGAGQVQQAFAGATCSSALSATEAFVDSYLNDRAGWSQVYDAFGSGIAHDLREVAKIMYGVSLGVPGMDARYFQVSMPGFDTHAHQGSDDPNDRHYKLISDLSNALTIFYADLFDMGVLDDTVIVIWSEFGRRVRENGNGTDHGSSGPVFVLGGSVVGGIYGNHPDISAAALDGQGNIAYSQNPGNPYRSTDFRDVYGTLLKRWIGLSEATILSQILTPETLAFDPNEYWVDGNHDFDLGFLPPSAP